MTDMRCDKCKGIGCECPQGYVSSEMVCDVCGYRFILTSAACVAHIVKCPECRGSISEPEESAP